MDRDIKPMSLKQCVICGAAMERNRRKSGAMETPGQYVNRHTCGNPACHTQHKRNVGVSSRGRTNSPAQRATFAPTPKKQEFVFNPKPGCMHHWKLAPQYGTTGDYEARCIRCGAERTYPRNPDLTLRDEAKKAASVSDDSRI